MNLGEKIKYYRKEAGMTQAELAEVLQVSFQAVSSWERGQYMPDMEKLSQIASVLHVSVSFLVDASENSFDKWEMHDRIFYEEHMYAFAKTTAAAKKLSQTEVVLPLARKLHDDRMHEWKSKVPYIYHPLMIACHALALKLEEDDIVASSLLHGVCKNCGVVPEDFPVNENVREALTLLNFDIHDGETREEAMERYYLGISENRLATIVKILYWCNNMSTIVMGFPCEKMTEYVDEMENYVFPLLECMKTNYPECRDAAFLLKYQMLSLLESLKRMVLWGDNTKK